MAKKVAKAARKTPGRPKKEKTDDLLEDFGIGNENSDEQITDAASENLPVPAVKKDPRLIGRCPIVPGPMGDKDERVVEWFKANAPDEYERRYAGRKTHIG